MFVIKSHELTKKNEYEIHDDIAYLKLQKKDGTIIDTKIDVEDIDRVLEKATWFAQWNKDFNNYIARGLNETVKETKQMLQTFLMDVHPKAPVRHLNGDTLDNRKSNLEIYAKDKPNDFEDFNEEAVAIILRDKYGKENARAIVDKEDIQRVIDSGYCWVCYKNKKTIQAVVNTVEGKVYLNRFIMNTPEDHIIRAINLNYLDSRKANLKQIDTKNKSKNDSEAVSKEDKSNH